MSELKEYVLDKTSTINRNIVETLSEEGGGESDFSLAKMTVASDSNDFSALIPVVGNGGMVLITRLFKAGDEIIIPLYKNKLGLTSSWRDFEVQGNATFGELKAILNIIGDFTISYSGTM